MLVVVNSSICDSLDPATAFLVLAYLLSFRLDDKTGHFYGSFSVMDISL